MSNQVRISFPNASEDPTYVYSATLKQKFYEHEVAEFTFKDWGYDYDNIRPGTPVEASFLSMVNSRDFYGYIHHVETDQTAGKNFITVTCIGGSFPLKQASQGVYKGYTADMVVDEIASKHGLVAITNPHPRVFEQISHPGLTDWQMLVKLAKQIGWGLRTENTEVYLKPLLEDYKELRAEAPTFTQLQVGMGLGSVYTFKPIISESLSFDGDMKAAVAVGGVDKNSKSAYAATKQKRNKRTRAKSQEEFFDRYNTDAVTTNAEIAEYEAEAAELRNAFPYRAEAELMGSPSLRPGMPIYLNGLGPNYSGFWTVLSTEHKIKEETVKNYVYTTVVTLGTDGLGQANRWEDGQDIQNPVGGNRVIIPNKKNTKVKAKTKLVRTGIKYTPTTKDSFGKIKNRSKLTTANNSAAVWKTASKAVGKRTASTEPKRTAATAARVAKAVARTR
jgi:hypothetical protein